MNSIFCEGSEQELEFTGPVGPGILVINKAYPEANTDYIEIIQLLNPLWRLRIETNDSYIWEFLK